MKLSTRIDAYLFDEEVQRKVQLLNNRFDTSLYD